MTSHDDCLDYYSVANNYVLTSLFKLCNYFLEILVLVHSGLEHLPYLITLDYFYKNYAIVFIILCQFLIAIFPICIIIIYCCINIISM